MAFAGLLVSATSGAWLFYQMNVISEYVTSDEVEERLADYEKSFLQYEGVRQPSITSVELNVDLFPADGKAYFEGTYQLINDTGAPVNELHVVFQDGYSELVNIDIPSATLTLDEGEITATKFSRWSNPCFPERR